MSTTYLGQIMLTGFGFAPKGMANCNGMLLPISQQQALFSLLGVAYGGNGTTNFALPDLRGRTPIGAGGNGSTYNIGQPGGSENVTLLPDQIPAHNHMANYTTATGSARNPALGLYGQTADTHAIYANASGAQVSLNPNGLTGGGGNQPHPNMQPFTVLNFCIAMNGIFPSRS